jgi:hypothetical protein
MRDCLREAARILRKKRRFLGRFASIWLKKKEEKEKNTEIDHDEWSDAIYSPVNGEVNGGYEFSIFYINFSPTASFV